MWSTSARVSLYLNYNALPPGSGLLSGFLSTSSYQNILVPKKSDWVGLTLALFVVVLRAPCLCIPHPRVQPELRRSKQALDAMEANPQVREVWNSGEGSSLISKG